MRRILFTYEKNMPTIALSYEMFNREQFLAKGIQVTFKCIKAISQHDLENNDIIYMMRPNDVISAKVAKQAHKSGLFVIFFCDDDLFHLPKDLPNIPYRVRKLKKCLVYSDMVVSSSEYLAKQIYEKTRQKRYFLINTIVDTSDMITHEDNKKIKFLYAGSVTHKRVFSTLIQPIVANLINKYGKEISFTFIGVHPDMEEFVNKTEIEFYSSMPLNEYRNFVKNNKFDYGLAPLQSNEFTKCKYFNKYLEYTLSGVVGIYSKVEPYTFVIKDKVNGYLVDDNPDEWLKTLEEVIKNKGKRKDIVEVAQKDVKENFSAEKIFSSIYKDIPEILNHDRGEGKVYGLGASHLNYAIHRIFDTIYLVFYHLFHKGPVGLIRQIKLHRKEMKTMKKLEEK